MFYLTKTKKVKSKCIACGRSNIAHYAGGMCKSDYACWMRQRRWLREGKTVGLDNPYCSECGRRGADVIVAGTAKKPIILCKACKTDPKRKPVDNS